MLGRGRGRGRGGQRHMTAQNKLSQRVCSLETQHRTVETGRWTRVSSCIFMKPYNQDPTLGGEPWFMTFVVECRNIPPTFQELQVMCSSCA